MKLTLHLPGLTWYDAHDGPDVCRDLATPALSLMLARGQRRASPAKPSQHLQHSFALPQLALAATLAQQAGLDTRGRHWLIADPVNLRVDRDRALLGDVGIMNLAQAEADLLIASLNQLFAEDGFVFHAPTPARWFISLPQASEATFTPLPDVIGEDINHHLPAGANGMRWSRYLNEMQMLLYTHAANDARELRGDTPVNSVWLWGEQGADSPAQQAFAPCLHSDNPLYQALATASGMAVEAVPYQFSGVQGDTLYMVLDPLEAAAQFRDAWGWREALKRLEQDWFAPMLAALKAGQLKELVLSCDGEAGFTLHITPRQLWKFWQPGQPLSALYPS
jgi:hypothetical protein